MTRLEASQRITIVVSGSVATMPLSNWNTVNGGNMGWRPASKNGTAVSFTMVRYRTIQEERTQADFAVVKNLLSGGIEDLYFRRLSLTIISLCREDEKVIADNFHTFCSLQRKTIEACGSLANGQGPRQPRANNPSQARGVPPYFQRRISQGGGHGDN